MAEEQAVDDAEGKGIGGAVRKTGDSDALGIDRIALEYLRQGGVDEGNVRAAAATDHVPAVRPRIRREDDAPQSSASSERIGRMLAPSLFSPDSTWTAAAARSGRSC